MKTIINKSKQILTKYDTHIYAILLTTIFTGLFALVLMEVIAQAFIAS